MKALSLGYLIILSLLSATNEITFGDMEYIDFMFLGDSSGSNSFFINLFLLSLAGWTQSWFLDVHECPNGAIRGLNNSKDS